MVKSFITFLEGEVVSHPKRLVGAIRMAYRNSEPTSSKKSSVDEWVKTSGGSITKTDAYEHHCNWCEKNGKEPMAFPQFNRHVSDSGVTSIKLGGRLRYLGYTLPNQN